MVACATVRDNSSEPGKPLPVGTPAGRADALNSAGQKLCVWAGVVMAGLFIVGFCGFARFLPGPYHVPRVFFLPQLLLLGVLVVWMVRVRLMGWYRRHAAG